MPLNLSEFSHNREWLHSKWRYPPYRSKAFYKELEDLGMPLERFKETEMYKRAVNEGMIVDDKWVPETKS